MTIGGWPPAGRSCAGLSTSAPTHFDLADNYGPPYGSAEINFGRIFAEDFARGREVIVISSKAGYDMWRAPTATTVREYLLASLDQSLQRLRLDHVDIFYSHRFDRDAAGGDDGRAGRRGPAGRGALRRISSYGPRRTEEANLILRELGTPLLTHQPSYSMFTRWIETELLGVLGREGIGVIEYLRRRPLRVRRGPYGGRPDPRARRSVGDALASRT